MPGLWRDSRSAYRVGGRQGPMKIIDKIRQPVVDILQSGDMPTRRPALDSNRQSNIAGLYVIGDLAGAPVIKLAMAQGFEMAEHIASRPDAKANQDGVFDVMVVGAGASGL